MSDRAGRTGGLAAMAAAAVLVLAACSATGSAAGAGAAGGSGATTAPATPAATTDLTGGSGYGGYGGGATTQALAATQGPAASTATSGAGGSGTAYVVNVATDAAVGSFLTGEDGKTLYVFKKDSPGSSACTGQCSTNWPPFSLDSGETAKAGTGVTGTIATITRSDGSIQVTYNDAPLYYFAADRKAGDVTGQGVGGVWFVATP